MQRIGSLLFRLPRPGSTSARALLLLLCLVTWRGPVPCVHAHGSEKAADGRLERHLQVYHQGHLKETFFALHLHMLLPWERFESPDETTQVPAPDPLSEESVVVVWSMVGEFLLSLSDASTRVSYCDQQLLSLVLLQSLSNSWRTYCLAVAPFSSSMELMLMTSPLCAVTGVWLC